MGDFKKRAEQLLVSARRETDDDDDERERERERERSFRYFCC